MRKPLTNDFSWSKSRHEKLGECARAYYFHYYQSWGGWDAESPTRARQLYVLKKLSNRYTWAGSLVHSAVRGALEAIRDGRTVEPARALERVHRVMQQDYVFSRGKGYWNQKHRKEFAGLVEHEYGEPVSPPEWKASWETVKAALEWFYASPWLPLARTLRPEQWIEVDEMDFEKSIFHLEGVKVFAVPDFAYYDDQGVPVVVDWKTGKAREGYDEQVLGYALYLAHRYQLPVEKIRASLVYLNEGVEHSVSIDAAGVQRFHAYFGRSVARMRSFLSEPVTNAPHPEAAFPMTSDPVACSRCVFRRACGRDRVTLAATG